MVFGSLPIVLALLTAPGTGSQQSPQGIVELAESAFAEGRVEESIALFDRLAVLVPSVAPTLWQRGIALYVVGRYSDCAAQFASFYAEDPGDLENAAWHFLCVARAESPARARAALLKAGPDPRILRQQIYEMLSGQRTPMQLLDLALKSVAIVQFYGRLYTGLYLDASGDRAHAVEHLTEAADSRYDAYGGFMNVVAKVYLARLRSQTLR